MLYKSMVLFVMCLSATHLSNGFTQKTLCSNTMGSITVEVVFKFRDFMGLIVKTSETSPRTAIRVIHWHQLDSSGKAVDEYYEHRVWNEITDIDDSHRIRLAFSTSGDKLFASQITYEMVFFVEDTNRTTAYHFNEKKVKHMIEPTFDRTSVVYDYKANIYGSDYLLLEQLYNQFPYFINLTAILIFKRKNVIRIKGETHLKSQFDDYTHFAIVYTSEMYEGTTYYFRNYVQSEHSDYVDKKGKWFKALRWFFPPNIDFCDELETIPSAVTLIGNEEEITNSDSNNKNKLILRFIEFYGTQHKYMKIVFPSPLSDNYTIEEDKQGQLFDNADVFTRCKPLPSVDYTNFECFDYPKNFIVPGIEHKSEDILKSESNQIFLFFAIILTILLILVLLAFCLSVLNE